jgi:hypothetical protein
MAFIAAMGRARLVRPETTHNKATAQEEHEAPAGDLASPVGRDQRRRQHRPDSGDPFERPVHRRMSALRRIRFRLP